MPIHPPRKKGAGEQNDFIKIIRSEVILYIYLSSVTMADPPDIAHFIDELRPER